MPGEFGNPSRSPAFRADIWSVIVRYLHVILGSDDMSDMFIGQQLARHDTTGCDQSIPMRCITFRHLHQLEQLCRTVLHWNLFELRRFQLVQFLLG
jgi:hypothetical protein